MNKSKIIFISIFFLFLSTCSYVSVAQRYTQVVQGYVHDSFTGNPLPGATVLIENDSLKTAVSTDSNGFFSFGKIGLAKYSITVSYIGYAPYYNTDIRLSSGKTVNLEITLTEDSQSIGTVYVNANKNKSEPENKMALSGARSFSLEETMKYAGSYGDPARMAMNYAGVLPVRDNRNDIIIRGNSAFGLQWRIADIEIPNPNHFGASATTGGPITIINTNLLSKSDFFYGAFPAEYGNAIAGVFDLQLRAGSVSKHEKWLQLGWNGLELGLEGPLNSKRSSSYLVSYRHSINDIMYKAGIDAKDIISYKDLTFKFNFPSTKSGNWSLVGMGGNSRIILDQQKYDLEDRPFKTYGEKIDNYSSMGVLALVNKIYPNKNVKIVNTLSVTANDVENRIDTFTFLDNNLFYRAGEDSENLTFSAKTKLNYKFSEGGSFSAGIIFNHYILGFHDTQYIGGEYNYPTDTSNVNTSLIRAFVEYRKSISTRFTIYSGIHSQYFLLNRSYSVEPRLGARLDIGKKSNLAYGFGIHSQQQPAVMYFVKTYKADETYFLSNINLDFTKSIHNTLSYNLQINSYLRLKAEAYYQYLYQVPVRENLPQYSAINFGTEYYVERKDSLVNEGTGTNYGFEFTFEQYLKNNFFYLFTASIFESKYKGADNITRNTAYNGKFALNALAGYELSFPKKYVSLVFGVNITYAGGSPYIPFDSQKTREQKITVLDWSKAYTVTRNDYKRISFRLGIKRNFKKSSLETSFDLQYRTDYTAIYQEIIDVTSGEIIDCERLSFYPMIYTRFNF